MNQFQNPYSAIGCAAASPVAFNTPWAGGMALAPYNRIGQAPVPAPAPAPAPSMTQKAEDWLAQPLYTDAQGVGHYGKRGYWIAGAFAAAFLYYGNKKYHWVR
jgi:hypothetical protein